MYVYAIPVSGGGFVSQLGILQHLGEAEYVPDITLSSSGGNVAAYVGAAADWKWAGIERIAGELSQDLFITPWNSIVSISMIIGYFKGDVYNKGKGVANFLKRNFVDFTICKYEIWTGTYNSDRQKARLFCNRSRDHSILDVDTIDHDLTQSMAPVFAEGNVDLIGEAGIASASLPAIVPPQSILGENYVDGGVACASPLTIMQEPILKYAREVQTALHIIYINSVDLSSPNIDPIHNVIDAWKQATHNLVRSQTVVDRLSGYELLKAFDCGHIKKMEFKASHDTLLTLKEAQKTMVCSLLEIYPTKICDIDILNFTNKDIVRGMKDAYDHSTCRLWYISYQKETTDLLSSIV